MTATTNAMIRRGATAGLVGPILLTVVVMTAALFFDAYSHLDDKISELGGEEARQGWIQSAIFVLIGLSVIR